MVSGKMAKLVLFELLQFAGLTVPIFVVMQRFAAVLWQVQQDMKPPGNSGIAYWLIVASSIAYVATTTLLVWVPVKYLLFRRSGFFRQSSSWRPVTLVFVILSTLPCFAFFIASSQVQIHHDKVYDSFSELPVSLVLLSLVCVDVIDRIRPWRLTGQDETGMSADFPGPVLVHMETVSTVTGQLGDHRDESWTRANGSGHLHRYNGQCLTCTVACESYPDGCLQWLRVRDPRSEVFVSRFLFWLDTVEMLRVASLPFIYPSVWLFPIYIVSYLSTLQVIAAPQSPWLPSLSTWLQDFPFLIVRIALIAAFGPVTPVLYLVKNLLVTLSFVYFNYITKLRIFHMEHML
ncbi:transmembrane protein 236-like [Arapaima gigas]